MFRKDPSLAELCKLGGRNLCTFRMRQPPFHDSPLRAVETYRAPVSILFIMEAAGLMASHNGLTNFILPTLPNSSTVGP